MWRRFRNRFGDIVMFSVAMGACVQAEIFLGQKFSDRFLPALTSAVMDAFDADDAPLQATTAVTEDRRPVTVVLIGDRGEDARLADSWPLSLDAYSNWLTKAWCLGARAVYLDVPFTRGSLAVSPPGAGEHLHELAQRLAFGAATPSDVPVDTCPVGMPARGWQGVPQKMPVYFSNPDTESLRTLFDSGRHEYRPDRLAEHEMVVTSYLKSGEFEPFSTHQRTRRAVAAVALAKAVCDAETGPAASACYDRIYSAGSFAVHDRLDSYGVAETAADVRYEPGNGYSCGRNAVARGAALLRIVFGNGAQTWATCPPVPTLSWFEFSTVIPAGRSAADHWNALQPMVRGKLLVLAAASPEIGNVIDTPEHDQLPQPYLVALATRQLLVTDARLWRSGPIDWPRHLAALATAFFVAWSLVTLLRVRGRLRQFATWLGIPLRSKRQRKALRVMQRWVLIAVRSSIGTVVLCELYRLLEWNTHPLVLAVLLFWVMCGVATHLLDLLAFGQELLKKIVANPRWKSL